MTADSAVMPMNIYRLLDATRGAAQEGGGEGVIGTLRPCSPTRVHVYPDWHTKYTVISKHGRYVTFTPTLQSALVLPVLPACLRCCGGTLN